MSLPRLLGVVCIWAHPLQSCLGTGHSHSGQWSVECLNVQDLLFPLCLTPTGTGKLTLGVQMGRGRARKQMFPNQAFMRNHDHNKKGRRLARSCHCYLQSAPGRTGLSLQMWDMRGEELSLEGPPAEKRGGSGWAEWGPGTFLGC